MFKFEKLLVCLDLTDMDDYLIRYANYLVNTFQAKSVKFIHVMDNYEFPEDLSEAFEDDDERSLEELFLEEVNEKVEKHFEGRNGIKPEVVVEEGHTVERIVKFASKNSIDLALLGKKIDYEGKGGVVTKIIGLIPSSVLLITESTPYEYKKIMVHTRFEKPSAVAYQAAAYFKEHTRAVIEFHHVYKLPYNYFPVQKPKEMKKLRVRFEPHISKRYSKFLKKFKLPSDTPFQFSINVKGDEAQSIYSYAQKNKIDLVVTGTRVKSHLANLIMDSTSEKLAGVDKDVPVLIVKDVKEFVGFFKALFE
ncbi:MAG: universal stress protein [Mariniphaga sp.]|nr:universal stress protein [Mariniphaga sp.]